ncbi:MAG: 3-oxoadipate enol-lactonase [Pseudomonadota bacterium]
MADFQIGDGCNIAYDHQVKEGARTLVLAHALGTSRALFDPQVAALSQHFSILRYDMRGHGASDAPVGAYSIDRLGRDLIELLDHLSLEDVDLAGVSLGGMIGQWVGYRLPERFGRLVLANTSAAMLPPSAWDERIRATFDGGMEPMVAPALERWFTPGFLEAKPQAAEEVASLIRRTPAAGYAGCCAAIRDMDMRRTAELIACECLVLYGEHDPATPPDQAHHLISTIPNARGKALQAAHLANVEQPAAFTAALLEFLI